MHSFHGFRPHALAFAEAGIEPPPLPDMTANGALCDAEGGGDCLNLGAKLFGGDVHVRHPSVMNHTWQGDASHSRLRMLHAIRWSMEIDETFRQNLKAARLEKGWNTDELSKRAGGAVHQGREAIRLDGDGEVHCAAPLRFTGA